MNIIVSAIIFTLLNPFFCFAASARQPITVKTQLDRHSASIGDKVKYTIYILADKHLEVELPAFQENLGDFAVKDFGKTEHVFFQRKAITQWYLLDTYSTGRYTLPKPVIKYKSAQEKAWSRIEGSQEEIEVKSLLGASDAHLALRDIKAPVGLPVKWSKFFLWGAVVLIILSAVLAYRFFQKKNTVRESILRRPAHEIACEQLEALKAKDYIAKGQLKEYFFELSLIIRYYLENRFGLRAPEMTTEEFLIHVRDYSDLAVRHKANLREFLSHCDLVKFARYSPSPEEAGSLFDSAKDFIAQTKDELS
jgi:hypothetical protein